MKALKLFEILDDNHLIKVEGNLDVPVTGIQIDSRKVEQGNVFVAINGLHLDGHRFIDKAIENGATVIVCESLPSIKEDVIYIQVKSTQSVVGYLAHRFYENDQDDLIIVGVTGTNGKSTIVSLLCQLFTNLGKKVGLISTIHNKIGDVVLDSTHTTPDAIAIASLISEMRKEGCTHVFMEVSSHGLDQQRVNGLQFNVAIFSNITHDHLNYHGTMLNYINAKKKLFDGLGQDAFALINMDDKNGKVMVQNTKAQIKGYALKSMADYKCKLIDDSLVGLHLRINNHDVYCRMSGEFNAYNISAVYGTAILLDENEEDVIKHLSNLEGVDGRLQKVIVDMDGSVGIVDYAHTPDALENVLNTLRKTKPKTAKIITVIGCGGDRDKEKRPQMAMIATSMSDRVILTSDNPRTEDPEDILDDMEKGIEKSEKSKVVRITDRLSAIKTAVLLASDKDVILVAGKGHEKYQEIEGVKHPFEDKKVLLSAMKGES